MSIRAAAYCRFSTDKQSADSAEDQLRVCRALAQREGFELVEHYADPGITGGTSQRPGYQRMLAAARRGEFDVIIAEDLKRLWREQAEQWRCIKELLDLKVSFVTVSGIDSRQKNFEMIAAVMGAAGELDRKEAGYRTRRGLEGRALKGTATGGKAYGYVPSARADGSKWWSIVQEQAVTVRWIYEHYAKGWSPRRIAAELNALCVPSPGSTWKRVTRRRDGKWLASTINGSILRNPQYCGRRVWGRVAWERSNVDSLRRRPTDTAASSWITTEIPELRIVDDVLWQRVQSRLASRRSETVAIACAPKPGRAAFTSRGGRPSKYPLSGLLKCGTCGSNFVVADARNYACSSRLNGGEHACANDKRVGRLLVEDRVVATLRNDLLTPERVERFRRRLAARINAGETSRIADDAARRRRLADVETKIANITAAICAGIFTPSTKAALEQAEAERARLTAAQPAPPKVVRMVPAAVARYQAMVAELPGLLRQDPDRARDILRRLLGVVELLVEDGALWARIATSPGRLLQLAGLLPNELQNSDGSGGRI